MRGLTVFLFFFLALASATVVKHEYKSKVADHTFLVRQKQIFQLCYHAHQPNIHHDQVELGKAYNIEANMDKYDDAHVVKHFMHLYRSGMLKKGDQFSVLYADLMSETEYLFKLFYHAKDWDTFYKTACWAREFMNEHMFIYTMSVAVLHRPDCQGFILPPPYEMHPHYYFTTEVIDKAYQVKMQGHGEHLEDVHQHDKHVYIHSNYSSWYQNYDREQRLAYLTEDIGWNAFYYYNHMDYPFWMEGEKYGLTKDNRGEIYYFLHQQLLARYYLERLSNGMGEIPFFSWHWPVETGYYPALKYFNGIEFPQRPKNFDLKQGEFLQHLTQVEDYEMRIREAIDLGYVVKPDGTHVRLSKPEDIEVLSSIVESNADTPNLHYYRYAQSLAKMLLGNSPRPHSTHKVYPSTLELFQTCLRDPMFYQMQKRHMTFYRRFIDSLLPYTKEELTCPGVKIENVEVEKLYTYFETYDVDITNAVLQTPEEVKKMDDDVIIHARQSRLNHMPFAVTVNVVSEKATKVSVRFFLGPKYNGKGDLIPMHDNKENFFRLDHFVYELKSGKNTIQRSSEDFWTTVDDFTPARTQYKEINDAIDGKKEFVLDMKQEHSCYPDRLLLPKGRKGGMPFYLYVIISEYHEPTVAYGTGYDEVISTGVGSGARKLDGYSYGYPFDRPIWEETDFIYNNMHLEDVLIFHKKESDINMATHD